MSISSRPGSPFCTAKDRMARSDGRRLFREDPNRSFSKGNGRTPFWPPGVQIGQFEAAGLLVAKLATALSGVLGDVLSHSKMILLGAFLSFVCKPMFAASGLVNAGATAGHEL